MTGPPGVRHFPLHWGICRSSGNGRPSLEIPEPDADAQEIEVWSYRPGLLADGDRVDPLSLYLSQKDSRDERVEAALEELMRTLPW